MTWLLGMAEGEPGTGLWTVELMRDFCKLKPCGGRNWQIAQLLGQFGGTGGKLVHEDINNLLHLIQPSKLNKFSGGFDFFERR